MFGISCDNADSLHPWAVGLGTLSFPLLADFWPHGCVSQSYGALNNWGVPDRVMILINRDMSVCYADYDHIDQVPPVDPIIEVCKRDGRVG